MERNQVVTAVLQDRPEIVLIDRTQADRSSQYTLWQILGIWAISALQLFPGRSISLARHSFA